MLHRRNVQFTLVIASVLGLCAPAAAVRAGDPPQKITSVEGITEYRLSNGLQVLLFPDPSRAKLTVNLTVLVGSRHEGYGETGMAHLLEHMLFKPTAKHPNIPAAMKERGANFNGSTWLDRTNYFETLPASDENLEFAIALEADRLVNCPIKPEDLSTEFSVVRNEFESGENSPGRVLSQRMKAVAYEWHNYGKSTIGNRSDIERVPVDNLREFYKKFYQPDNAVLIVAGKFDEKKALALIEREFGAIPRPTRQLPKTYTEEPAQDGERVVTLKRVGDAGIVGVVYHVPAGTHEQFPAIDILSDILSNEPSGRLYKALVETKLATDVSVDAQPCHDPGIIEFSADVDTKDRARLDVVRDALFAALDKVVKDGVTSEEVERARRRFLKNRELAAADPNRIAVQLSEWASQGDWRLYFLFRDSIEKVEPKDVQAVAKAYLTPSNRTVGYFIPTAERERTPVPQGPDVAKLLKDYKGRESSSTVTETFDTAPLAIESKIQRPGAIEGVKVAYLPKKTRGGIVSLRMTLHYGDAQSLKGLTEAAKFVGPLMMRGTKSMTRQQIQDALDKNFASIGLGAGGRGMLGGGDAQTFGTTLSTRRANLAAALDILRQVLREPIFPENELELMKKERIAALERNRSQPNPKAAIYLTRALAPYPPDDVRYVPTIDEQIDHIGKVTIAQVRQVYQDLLGTGKGELAVVGDFEPSEIQPILAKILENWSAKKPFVRIEHPYQPDVKPERVRIETPDKANAIYIAGMTMPVKDDDPDFPALVAGNFILGGGAISSRIADRLRQKSGLSYTALSMFAASSVDRRASLLTLAIYNPMNVDKVVTGMDEELARLLKDGVTESELAKAKAGFVSQARNGFTNDGLLANTIADDLYLGRTFAHQAELEEKINGLTPAAVDAAFKKHVDSAKMIVVTAGDFARKPAEPKK